MTQQGKPAFDPELHTNMLKEHARKDERVFTWKEIFENNQLKAPSGQPAKVRCMFSLFPLPFRSL